MWKNRWQSKLPRKTSGLSSRKLSSFYKRNPLIIYLIKSDSIVFQISMTISTCFRSAINPSKMICSPSFVLDPDVYKEMTTAGLWDSRVKKQTFTRIFFWVRTLYNPGPSHTLFLCAEKKMKIYNNRKNLGLREWEYIQHFRWILVNVHEPRIECKFCRKLCCKFHITHKSHCKVVETAIKDWTTRHEYTRNHDGK